MSSKSKENNVITDEDIREVMERIQELYLADEIPWTVGYSGGKDSTATLQLVWNALAELPKEKRRKPVYVISTNTLVESPVVDKWVDNSVKKMDAAAREQRLPIYVNRLTPEITESFWVLLIGRGYPAPRPNFRWCTDRLKIKPSNRFITSMVAKHGEVILVLGTRMAESSKRAASMKRYEEKRVREWLSPTKDMSNCLSFTPIGDWSNDDVWKYLGENEDTPWGQSNLDIFAMYSGASADGECPFVRDINAPSCGNSRFGCWVCTMVQQDRSMQAMIDNDEDNKWMKPLLDFRNELGKLGETRHIDDRDKRDFRRMHGEILLHRGRAVHGPYTKKAREDWLSKLLKTEQEVQKNAPKEFKDIRLISDEELRWIRRIWVMEKHEFDDSLPGIYEEIKGKPYPYYDDLKTTFGKREWDLLKEICQNDEILFELQTRLLDITQQRYGFVRRKGVLEELEQTIRRCYYEDEDDAVRIAEKKREIKKLLKTDEIPIQDLFDKGVDQNNH